MCGVRLQYLYEILTGLTNHHLYDVFADFFEPFKNNDLPQYK